MAWEKVLNDPSVHTYLSDLRIKWSLIIELSPWMGGFCELLVGITKMSLRKSIGRVSVTSFQLQTILTEIEAVINTRPWVFVHNDLEKQIITPAHFISINIKTVTPVLAVKNEHEETDPSYHVEEMNTAKRLLESWKKGQRHLEQFWELWKNHYLFNLRERSQLLNKHPRV